MPIPALLMSLQLAGAAETSVNLSPMGVLGFTLLNVADYALNVEHVRGAHGLILEADGIHIHGGETHTTTLGGNLGYRFHREGGTFFGVMAGYKQGFSKFYTTDDHDEHWRYSVKHVSVIPHVGHRWPLRDRLHITGRLGAGYGRYTVSTDAVEEGVDEATRLLEDRLQFTPIKVDGELSLGVRF